VGQVRTRGAVVAGVVACALVAAAPAVGDGVDRRRDLHPQHTSGGQAGWIVPPRTSAPGARLAVPRRSDPVVRTVVPGVIYTEWTQTDERGPIRAHLLAINPKAPGVRLDYSDTGSVRGTATVPQILAVDNAVAGVNGDFYDIGRTGAPLGLGKDRQRGILHGRTSGWNNAFYLDSSGRPQIGDLPMRFRLPGHPKITITGLNQPVVQAGSIGVYTAAWGKTAGSAVVEGQTKGIRVVQVLKGRVVGIHPRLRAGKPIKGNLLVGRGAGATQLKELKRGQRVKPVRAGIVGSPRMVITGDKLLVDDGLVYARNDTIMHPRTAVGIDRDTGEVLLLVVDGRSSASRGYTMVEMADLMVDLGADEALNLDGGGSSTMVTRVAGGARSVVNTPSDGFLRHVSNALEVTYTQP
jgi:hypothetical protein